MNEQGMGFLRSKIILHVIIMVDTRGDAFVKTRRIVHHKRDP